MILSHQKKFIFFCNGRTASSSMEAQLNDYQQGQEYNFGILDLFIRKHIPPALLKACLPEAQWQAYFKFVFVRHPMDWVRSQWKHNFKIQLIPHQLAPQDRHTIQYINSRARQTILHAEDIDFLFDLLKRYRALPGAQGLYQSNYVFDPDGKKLVDYMGRFEHLRQDWSVIVDQLKLPQKVAVLPHINASNEHTLQLSKTAQNRIKTLWACDFERFNYQA